MSEDREEAVDAPLDEAMRVADGVMVKWRKTLDWLTPYDGQIKFERCSSVNGGDRCDLTAGHSGRHAHSWSEDWTTP